MSSLYQITVELAVLEQMLEAEGGDVTEGSKGESLQKFIEQYEWLQREKIDSYCELIANKSADANALEAEAKRLTDRARTLKNQVDRLKEMAKLAMDLRKVKKIEGQKFTVAIQKNGGKDPVELIVEDVEKYPAHVVKIVKSIDKEAIRAALESNDPEVEKLARLGERGESVRIR